MRPALALPFAILALAACSSDRSVGPRGGALETPQSLVSVSLNTAVQLSWDPNARVADPNSFSHYNIYSTSYDLDTSVCDDTGWALEGTSVSEDFLVSGLTNGVPLCFAVSSVSTGGNESAVSAYANDTPRYDSRNVTGLHRAVTTSPRAASDSTSDRRRSSDRWSPAIAPTSISASIVTTTARIWLTTVRQGTSVVLVRARIRLRISRRSISRRSTATSRARSRRCRGMRTCSRRTLSDGLHYGAIRVTSHVSSEQRHFRLGVSDGLRRPAAPARAVAGGGSPPVALAA